MNTQRASASASLPQACDAPDLLEKFFKLSYSTDPVGKAANVGAPKLNVKETAP